MVAPLNLYRKKLLTCKEFQNVIIVQCRLDIITIHSKGVRMFEKDSIKFKLIFVISVVIVTMITLLVSLQLYGILMFEKRVEKNTKLYLEGYSSQVEAEQLATYNEGLNFYISTMADVLSHDLYNLDLEAISKKLEKLVKHRGICSLSVLDTVANVEVARIDKTINNACQHEAIHLHYNGQMIGIFNASYTQAPIKEAKANNQELISKYTQKLKDELEETVFNTISSQIFLACIITIFLLFVVARQITHNVILPIYRLLDDMKILSEEEILKVSQKNYQKDEISKLTKYFHKHIAKLINRLNRRANYDQLTHLLSRQRLMHDLSSIESFFIAILDIDRFKEINNYLGTKSGDRVLKSTAKSLRDYFLQLDYRIYRLNGDEFAILCPRDKDIDIQTFHKTINDYLVNSEGEEISYGDETLSISMSAGIATSEAKNPMVAATTALKYAKQLRSKAIVYNDELPIIKEYGNNLKMTKIITSAIAHDLVFPYFQPIQDIKSGKIVKFEALMRLEDTRNNLYNPIDFIAIAKHTGTYSELSKRMISKTIEYFTSNPYSVAINLSTKDIESENIYALIEELEKKYNIMHKVIFEITEQEGISSFEAVREFTQKIKSLGAKIAIDDFGSGYSNLENIIELDVDLLKIDGSLIKNILTDKSAEIVVETVVSFAKKLHIKTVAEFISSEEIYNKAKEMGIDYAQGYFIGKPEMLLRTSL